MISFKCSARSIFQSTSLSRGKTDRRFRLRSASPPFNPLPSHEGRHAQPYSTQWRKFFQSTSLSRGKTAICKQISDNLALSIHFPLTREDVLLENGRIVIETFNPLPSHEGRRFKVREYKPRRSFNPLPSHEGRRGSGRQKGRSDNFQSTSLSRGKTTHRIQNDVRKTFQSTSLSRGKTAEGEEVPLSQALSIHFPLTREDRCTGRGFRDQCSFNPLPSHEGRRNRSAPGGPRELSFNPLPSHEGRREIRADRIPGNPFQSTSLSRGKT